MCHVLHSVNQVNKVTRKWLRSFIVVTSAAAAMAIESSIFAISNGATETIIIPFYSYV